MVWIFVMNVVVFVERSAKMPIKMNHLCVVDTETSGLGDKCQPVEIACKVYHCRSLDPIPGAEWSSLCRPTEDCIIEDEALEINKIKREEIEKAPSIKIVFPQFVEFVNKYNVGVKKDTWNAPIALGHNLKFDIPIIDRMKALCCKNKEKTVLFNPMRIIDLMDISYLWFENTKELENYKLDSLRNLTGLPGNNAHRALQDVIDTGAIIMKFLKFHRSLCNSYMPKIRGCFKEPKELLEGKK